MKALVAAPGADGNVDLVDVAEPQPRPNEALVDVRATSLNRGEVHALEHAQAGWRPRRARMGQLSLAGPSAPRVCTNWERQTLWSARCRPRVSPSRSSSSRSGARAWPLR